MINNMKVIYKSSLIKTTEDILEVGKLNPESHLVNVEKVVGMFGDPMILVSWTEQNTHRIVKSCTSPENWDVDILHNILASGSFVATMYLSSYMNNNETDEDHVQIDMMIRNID